MRINDGGETESGGFHVLLQDAGFGSTDGTRLKEKERRKEDMGLVQ